MEASRKIKIKIQSGHTYFLFLVIILAFWTGLGNDHLTWRAGLCFFPKKNILILVEGKKKSDSEFLSYNLMLNSGKTISRFAWQKKIIF